MATTHVLYRGNDNLIEFKVGNLLTDATTGDLIPAATVTVRLLDTDDVEILAAVTMSAVAGESGNYRGTVPDTLDLSTYTTVFVEVTADNGAGQRGLWKLHARVENRA